VKSITDTLNFVRSIINQYSKDKKEEVLFALIGGHASIFYGVERTTLDVDICLYASNTSSKELYNYLKEKIKGKFNINLFEAKNDPTDPLKHDIIIIKDIQSEFPRIDILLAHYQWEIEGLKQAKLIKKISFPIFPLPYFICMKLLAGGFRDDFDIIEILKNVSEKDLKLSKTLAQRIKKDKKIEKLLKKAREEMR